MNFRHYKVLRKIIMRNKSGVLEYQTEGGFNGVLLFLNGRISSSDDNQQLIQFLSNTMAKTTWVAEAVELNTIPADEAIINAINHLQWSDRNLRLLSEMFSRFPRLKVTVKPVIFDHSLTDLSYNMFCHRVSSKQDFSVASFMLNNNPSNLLLIHRVRVLAYNYLLGFIHAAEGSLGVKAFTQEKKRQHQRHSAGAINRIMRRIRTLSS